MLLILKRDTVHVAYTLEGSSAMTSKRNSMRLEGISALAYCLQTLLLNPRQTVSTQWLERTLLMIATIDLVVVTGFVADERASLTPRSKA